MKTLYQIMLILGMCAGFAVAPLKSSTAPLTGDVIPTEKGNLVIHPINHATFAMQWDGKTIYVDPVGGTKVFAELPKPDLILITDIHPDHLNKETLTGVVGAKTQLIVSPAAAEQLPPELRQRAKALGNGQSTEWMEIQVEAVPAYNLTPERLQYHPKGRGNGYVLTMGGKRVYISGDTEDIPEMRNLKNIDVAFLCMNLPYTMTVEQASAAARAFKPQVLYPYHYRGADLQKLKAALAEEKGVEVRLRDWYRK